MEQWRRFCRWRRRRHEKIVRGRGDCMSGALTPTFVSPAVGQSVRRGAPMFCAPTARRLQWGAPLLLQNTLNVALYKVQAALDLDDMWTESKPFRTDAVSFQHISHLTSRFFAARMLPCDWSHGTIRAAHTTYAAALKTTTHPKTRCVKPYAATQHLMLLMMGVCTRNMSN